MLVDELELEVSRVEYLTNVVKFVLGWLLLIGLGILLLFAAKPKT